MPRDELLFDAVLLALALLTALLWFNDPHHQTSGKSRIDWPPAPPAQP